MDTNLIIYIAIALLVLIGAIVMVVAIRKKKPNTISAKEKQESLKVKLAKTKNGLLGKMAEIVNLRGKVDDDLMDDLEEMLLQADIGVQASGDIIDSLRDEIKLQKITSTGKIQKHLEEIIRNLLLKDYGRETDHLQSENKKPFVVLFTGVNGVGKTTSIGKLAYQFKAAGKKVILGAADTFRAAAVDQISIWADRVGVEIVKQDMGSDPASVAYDTVASAISKDADVVIIDTAGRLHNKVNLMNELTKIKKVMQKVIPDAPHEILLVLDGSTGQNARWYIRCINCGRGGSDSLA